MKIIADKITVTFKAGEAIVDGDVVYISAAGEVKKAATANAPKVVGVADAAAAAGENVDVVVYGKKKVTADGAIAVGDRLRAADTAGRVIAENTTTSAGHTHTENTAAAYTQNATTASATDTIAQGRLLGKALGAAAAGGALEILVCLA